ncbi:hypothetical protein [Paenibacillus hamazuiensis]|uniref:hypothetical protein n=1 Tax=Paenibacillus hamazuiensis TaxID=2936508 RepID=UPI00200DF9D2|nr:hypothetical protein [Paenibacillus hamazuiensis]
MKPDLSGLKAVAQALEKAGIAYALGGSGLLYSLGLAETVNDWDVMTEAQQDVVERSLRDFDVAEKKSGDFPFATAYKLMVRFRDGQPPVEMIGSFAIRSEQGLCRLPAIPSSRWEGIWTGSAEVWYAAYSLMQRTEKAELLLAYLRKHGVDREAVRRLLEEPLPPAIKAELSALHRRQDR